MATNKKISGLTELVEADLANDDVLPIVDVSAGTTHKVRKDTLAAALSGVSSISATSPIAVDSSTGAVTVSTGTVPVASGGTGATSLTDGGVLLGSGTAAVTAMAVLTDGQMIVGDGSGDPVAESGATLRTSIGVGTGDSPQFTAVNIGAATDTTVGRASAGDINVEGNLIYRAGGTDVPVADGGTGASSLGDGHVLLGSGTDAITALDVTAKGSILVGDGSGDPRALAVGSNDYVLTADSGEDSGLKWAASGSMSSFTMSDGSTTQTVSNGNTMTFAAGEAMDVAVSATDTVTYSAEDASVTNKGVSELATTAETTSGTDTGRVITPAGLHAGLAGLTDATITASDKFMFVDVGSSDALKTDTVQGILDLTSSGPTQSSVLATTSGTSVTIGSIPAGVNGTYETDTVGFRLTGSTASATFDGNLTLILMDSSSYVWTCSGNIANVGYGWLHTIAGSKALSAELTQIQFMNLTNTLDAGKFSIVYD